jgi:hypothetical protein
MADQSTPRRLSKVAIRTVDYARYKDDPIGMGLAGLQAALATGIDASNMRQAEEQEEGLRIADDLYKAYELAGVERAESDVADDFFKKTGKSIHAYTKSHARRVDEASGRIRGRNFTEDLHDRVKSGEFNNTAELQEAWDVEEREIEKFHPNNFAYSGGFLEQGAGRFEDLRDAVFNTSLAAREQQSLDVFTAEFESAFDARALSSADDNNALFSEAVVDIEMNIRLNNPTISNEAAENVLLNGIEGALAGEHYADIEEVSHILDQLGSIKTSEGRLRMKKLIRQAHEVEENRMMDPSDEVKFALVRAEAAILAKGAQTRGEIGDKETGAYLKTGQNTAYAANRLAALVQKMKTIYPDGNDVEGEPPTTADKIMEATLRMKKDPDAVYAYFDEHPDIIPRLVLNPDGEKMIARILGSAERAEGSKWDGVNRGQRVISGAVGTLEIAAEDGAIMDAKLNSWVDANPDMKVSEIQAKAQEFVDADKQRQADDRRVVDIETQGPETPGEADILLDSYRDPEAVGLKALEDALAHEASYQDAGQLFTGMASRGRLAGMFRPTAAQTEDFRLYRESITRRKDVESAYDDLVLKRQAIERARVRLVKKQAKLRGLPIEGGRDMLIFTGEYQSLDLIDNPNR